MELSNVLKNNTSLLNNNSLDNQKNFIQTTFGKIVNTALDVGIRALLPDLIEEQVINIKDSIFENGFKSGVQEAISSAVDMGKSVLGIFTGNFENVSQVKNAIKKGGIIDGISNALDYALNSCSRTNKIPNTVIEIIKKGKDSLLNTISKNIENEFENQLDSIEKINQYSNNWKKYYDKKDIDGMEKEYIKMEKELEKTIPLESTLKQARVIENLHTLIKNKNGEFNLTNEELELANKLLI